MMLFEGIVCVGLGLVHQTHQVSTVFIFHERFGEFGHFFFRYPAFVESDALQATYLAALAFFQQVSGIRSFHCSARNVRFRPGAI